MLARGVVCLLLLVVAGAVAQQVSRGPLTITALGEPGRHTGFRVTSQGAEVAAVMLGSNDLITARQVQATAEALRFTGLACDPTPTLGPSSFVEVSLLGDSPYPQVSFRLDLQAFDQAAWEQRVGQVPFHFLVCSLPGAEVFHQRGWAIGTPVVDDYIQKQAEGPGRTVVSNWSRDWTYAPPIGAYPTPIAGLWSSAQRQYVGYEFVGPRLTDHTEKDFGTSYCYQCKQTAQFFCLTWPFGEGYISLRYPKAPVQCGTHFRLLWSRDLGPEEDPNRFVHQFLWQTYADRLPDVERMSDLSWMPGSLRLTSLGTPAGLGSLTHNTGDSGETFWQPHVNIVGGPGYFNAVDYAYQRADVQSTTTLATECHRIVGLGKWMDVGGDRCFYWQTPLDGDGAKMFGPGVQTFHHVNGWFAGLALLDYYRNDPTGAQDLLPYVDGVLRYTKHILYTRNCYPDVPAAQFAWSATPGATFCWKYYYRFRDDPQRRDLAQLAHTLATSITYRYLALWPCDNDEMDDLDSSFFMEPNAGLPWLGSACANEVWVYNIAMLYQYVATGDPIMGHYLRGMLERYHQMAQDQYYPGAAAYPASAYCERFGLYKEAPQPKGTRADYGGLWGGLEWLIWPVGSAKVRVVCGEGAAMAFNREGRRADVAQYRYLGDGSFSFRIVPGGLQADPAEKLDVMVTFPFFRLAGKEVFLQRGDVRLALPPERVETHPGDASTLTLKGLVLGDVVTVGRGDEAAPVLPCKIAKVRAAPDAADPAGFQCDGFRVANLRPVATDGISRDWSDLKSLAGYEPGLKTLYGVPFLLLDPELTGNKAAVSGAAVPVGDSPQYLFALVGGVGPGSRLTLTWEDGRQEPVSLADAIPVLKGWPPCMEWHLDLVAVANQGKPLRSLTPTGCQVFAVSSTHKTAGEMSETLAALQQCRDQLRAQRELVASVVALKPLFEPFKGHLALLPVPTAGNPRSNPIIRLLHEAGLNDYVRILSPEDLVNPQVFNTRDVWIAFYFGGEDYYQSVRRQGDGDEALAKWLQSGGTLVSLASGPFPFYYNEKNQPQVSSPKFGLPISGSGAGARLDTLDVAMPGGWEKPPEGVQLAFHLNPAQKVLSGLPATIPWATEGEQRWRPLLNVVDPQDLYTPLVTLQDQTGRKYGEAAGMIEYRAGPLSGARVMYVWNGLRGRPELQRVILIDLLRYLLTNALRPVSEYMCPRAARPPVIDGTLDDEVWQQAPATELFTRFDDDRADGKDLKTTAKLAWDDQNLYVAFQCEDPDVWATMTQHDANLWEEEVVELYVDPGGQGKNYYEIEINPLNAVVDLKIPSARDGVPQDVEEARKWDAQGMVSAVKVDGHVNAHDGKDRGWTAEAAIPLSNFVGARRLPPKIGDVWRLQLLRIERGRPLPHPQFSAWSVTNTFHNPTRFGRLCFGGNPFHDDFSAYEEGAAPTPTWGAGAGEWKVTRGQLVGANSGANGFTPTGLSTGDASWKDYRLSVRFRILQRGNDHRDGAWIGFRYNGAGECYCLNLQGAAIELNKAAGGMSSSDADHLARLDWAPDDAWHAAVITARGPDLTVELDGKQIMQVTDRDYLGVPPLLSGGICLSARKWENSQGDTVVAFADVKVERL